MNCVAAIGYRAPGVLNNVPVAEMWHTSGTGFFYGKLIYDDPDQSKRLYSTYLVTAKHVIKGYETLQKNDPSVGNMKIRVNQLTKNVGATEFQLLQEVAVPGSAWIDNPNGKDVSIIQVNLTNLRDKNYEFAFFSSDTMVAKIDKLHELGTAAGDGVFVLGFPIDMAGIQKNYVIVRQGVIARIDELLDHASDYLMIDAFVFPGNSGGPVILRPEFLSISGTKNNANAYLIGLVNESIDYLDVAKDVQTNRPRIVFEENTGLTNASPVDYIEDTIPKA